MNGANDSTTRRPPSSSGCEPSTCKPCISSYQHLQAMHFKPSTCKPCISIYHKGDPCVCTNHPHMLVRACTCTAYRQGCAVCKYGALCLIRVSGEYRPRTLCNNAACTSILLAQMCNNAACTSILLAQMCNNAACTSILLAQLRNNTACTSICCTCSFNVWLCNSGKCALLPAARRLAHVRTCHTSA